MNSDDFEKRLRQQTFREVPANWRKEILDAVSVKSTLRVTTPQSTSSWRELFWPCPQAWASLAAVWLVILFINFSNHEETTASIAQNNAIQSPESVIALKQEWTLAELKSANERTAIDRPRPFQPRPHSKRREDFSFA